MSEQRDPEEPQVPDDGTAAEHAPRDGVKPIPVGHAAFAAIGRIDPLAGFRAQLADVVGPVAALQAQLRRNDDLLASVRSKIVADAGLAVAPSIMAALRRQVDPLAGFRAQLADVVGPVAALQAQLRRNDDLLASVRSKIVADAGLAVTPSIMAALRRQVDPLAGFRAQLPLIPPMSWPAAALRTQLPTFVPRIDPLVGIWRAGLLPSQTIMAALRTQAAVVDPLASTLQSLAEQARSAFPSQVLRQVLSAGTRLLLPDNLRHVRVQLWPWLLRICAKDGICLAWAPRAELVDMLITCQTSQARFGVLFDHRKEVLEDVTASLSEVDHPDLLVYRELVEEAVDCLVDGRDFAAQALLGNVLDSCMREHGHTWLTDRFTNAHHTTNMGSHKRLEGILATYDGDSRIRPGMFTAYLLVMSLKNMFGPAPRQVTFNRHLAAHRAGEGSYRSEFALSALLAVQALLRNVDGYLWAQT